MTYDDIIRLAGHRKPAPWVIKLVHDAVAEERVECARVCVEAIKAIENRVRVKE